MRDMVSSDTKRKLAHFFNTLTIEKETFAITLHNILQSKWIVLKEEEGKVIAAAGIRNNNTFFIVVKNEYQNQGIGQELTKEAIRQAIKRNYSHITLNVLYSNTKAIHIFQRRGFTPLFQWSNEGERFVFMTLPLNWRGKLARSILLIRHQFHPLNKLFHTHLYRIQNSQNK